MGSFETLEAQIKFVLSYFIKTELKLKPRENKTNDLNNIDGWFFAVISSLTAQHCIREF